MHRISAWLLAACFLIGCSHSGSETADSTAPASKPQAFGEPEMQTFLAVVRRHESKLIPEFAPEDNEPPDFSLPAPELAAWFRDKLHQVYDAERQGAAWENDPHWQKALEAQHISGTRFASFARQVTLAVLRIRLEARGDLGQLLHAAHQDFRRAHQTLETLDAIPRTRQTAETRRQRAQAALELGRSVALLEIAEMLRDVPDESLTLVRRFSRKLKPHLAANANEDLLAELCTLAVREENTEGAIEQASFETPNPKPVHRPATSRRR
jgi:hypothetical protein